MNKAISLSIFFPAYNEEANIREAVLRTIRVVENSPFIKRYEIIVVNDGSRDRTKELAQVLANIFAPVKVISHDKNRGYGAALKTGIAASKMDYIFFTDADLQFDISELQNLLIHVADNPVVIGYRAPRRDPLMRLFNAWGWNRLNRMLFGLKVRDIDCAFKIFKRNIVQRLELRSKGNMIGAETLIRLANMGVKFKEVPVSHLPRTAGSQTGAKPSAIVRALGEMIRLYRGDLGPVTDKMTLTFILVGAINTAIDIVAYILLTRTNQFFFEHLVLAKLLSFMLGLVSSLVLHRLWTFSIRERPNIVEALRFYSIFPAALVLNVAMMGLFIEIGIYDLLSLFLTTAVTFAFNFTLANLWIHHERSADIYRKVRKQSMVHNAFTQSQ